MTVYRYTNDENTAMSLQRNNHTKQCQKVTIRFSLQRSYNTMSKQRNHYPITSIDYENNAAQAKVEIDMPGMKRLYTDYFLLLKMEGRWKIVHKSFTYRPYPVNNSSK